jgi:spermidine/putrescine transport system ATP-binding protein
LANALRSSGEATIVVRPEHARIASGEGDLSGRVENVVYFGTDTNIHVRLDDGVAFIVRQQNSRSASGAAAVGDRVAIAVDDEAAQVLKD